MRYLPARMSPSLGTPSSPVAGSAGGAGIEGRFGPLASTTGPEAAFAIVGAAAAALSSPPSSGVVGFEGYVSVLMRGRRILPPPRLAHDGLS